MKKLLIEISEEAHNELIKLQAERKINREGRTTLRDVASDVLIKCLLTKKENPDK